MGEDQTLSSGEEHPDCVPHTDIESFSWIAKSKTRELLALPFDGMFHLSDEYELALISLHKKKWSYGQIAFLHFVFFAPLMELPVRKMSSLVGIGDILKRLIFCVGLIYGVFWGLQETLATAHLSHLFPALAGVLAVALITLHITLAMDTFQHWKFAYHHMDRGLLKSVRHSGNRKRRK